MATIGLYDIDFNHGTHFSISLPLMKAYRKLINDGHMVIMMKPYEKTGRYNKIFYFKDGTTRIPNSLTINTEKGKVVGYGFYGGTDLLKETMFAAPDFTPYDMNMDRIKNKTLYNSIKQNSIIDWREKDFAGVHTGAGITYVNDRNFMEEYDWEELFEHFDNNICFIHTLYPDETQLPILIQKNYMSSRIAAPIMFDKEMVLELLDTNGIMFNNKGVSLKQLLGFIAFVKTFSSQRIAFTAPLSDDPTMKRVIKWAYDTTRISYEQFCKKTNGYMPIDSFHYNFKPKGLLYQDPKLITPEEFKQEYLKQLT